MRHRHVQIQRTESYSHKILLTISKDHRLAVKVRPFEGHLVEIGELFLVIDCNKEFKKIYSMEKILEYCKENFNNERYLKVEKFFMERNV